MIGFKHLLVLVSLIFICSCKDNCVDKGGHDSIQWKNESSRTIDYIFVDYSYTNIPENYNPLTGKWGSIAPYSSEIRPASIPEHECYEQLFSDGKKEWLYFLIMTP